MQITYQQITEIIENLKLKCTKDARLAQIEKDIILENIRNLYLQIAEIVPEAANHEFAQKALDEENRRRMMEQQQLADLENRRKEIEAANQELLALKRNVDAEKKQLETEMAQLAERKQQLEAEKLQQVEEKERLAEERRLMATQIDAPKPASQEKYPVEPGITDDVDLFFDFDHESYNAQAPKSVQSKISVQSVEQQTHQPEVTSPVEPEPVETQLKPEPFVSMQPAQSADATHVSDEDELLHFLPKKDPVQSTQKPIEPQPVSQPNQQEVRPTVKQPFAKPNDSKIIAESVQPKRSLNDLFISQKEDKSIGAQFQHAKVTDLTKAISLNDKFVYIRELFNEKGEEFGAAIQKLNTCPTMEDAFNYLETLKRQYFWDSTSTAYLSLCDLLRRKYM